MAKQLFTREQARAKDQELISGGIPGYELMTRAGEAAVQCLEAKWPDAKRMVIFCGLGNNAGDGYVIARICVLAGHDVLVIQVGSTEKLSGDALTAYQDAVAVGLIIKPWDVQEKYTADVFVDALLGTGLNQPIEGDILQVVYFLNSHNTSVLAVDIPTGLDANTGLPLGDAVRADVTVTFIVYKQGLFSGKAENYCGEVVLAKLV